MSATAAKTNGANGRFSMGDYIDVAERIFEFDKKYPEGSLQTIDWSVEEIEGRTFIVYRAAAYRTPDDQRPGHGIAWEPFPGRTPYTRDSELMNAETAAWGRAIVACGLTSNRKIASLQEVLARGNGRQNGTETEPQANPQPQPQAAPAKPSERPANAKQRGMLQAKAREAGLDQGAFANVILAAAGEEPREWRGEEHAAQTLARLLDRLPASLVTAVKDAIAGGAT